MLLLAFCVNIKRATDTRRLSRLDSASPSMFIIILIFIVIVKDATVPRFAFVVSDRCGRESGEIHFQREYSN